MSGAPRGWILFCVLSCGLGSRRFLFGALSQALFLFQGVYALWTREVSWFSSSWLLRVFLFACLYGKRLVTTRFELKILMSTIISLGVFYRDLLSLFSPLVGDVYFWSSPSYEVFSQLPFSSFGNFCIFKKLGQLPPFLLRGLVF